MKSRRLALGLFQRQVADELGTDETTLFRWERDMAWPQIHYFPQILKFLGYDPFLASVTLADKLRAARRRLGLTQIAVLHRPSFLPHIAIHAKLQTPRSLASRWVSVACSLF